MKKEHILVIRFSAMGDVAMVVPVVYSLAVQYPDLRVTVLSRPFARPLFENLAPNVDFMEADLKQEYHGVRGLNALYRRLTAKQFTKVADLHDVLRSEYLRMRFNMGRYRVEHINKHRQAKRALVAHNNNKVRVKLPSSFQNYADVFERLGYPVQLSFRSVFPEGGGDLSMLPPAIGQKSDGEHWIGLAPTAAHRGKVYPYDRMRQVLEQLSAARPGSRFFLFGRGAEEDRLFREWSTSVPRCVVVGTCLGSLYQELILMSHLDVMVSMDSANMHLASLTATPVVSVWGATHPDAGFLGWGQPAANVVQADALECRPCSIYGNRPCRRGDWACLTAIQPQTIVKRVEEILDKD